VTTVDLPDSGSTRETRGEPDQPHGHLDGGWLSGSLAERVFTGTIHIYGGDVFGTPRSEWDPETREERPFDIECARKVFADANERWLAECAKAAAQR